jgi:hypothetical protein
VRRSSSGRAPPVASHRREHIIRPSRSDRLARSIQPDPVGHSGGLGAPHDRSRDVDRQFGRCAHAGYRMGCVLLSRNRVEGAASRRRISGETGGTSGPGWGALHVPSDEFLHHRGQLSAYARACGIEPPFIWDYEGNGLSTGPRPSRPPTIEDSAKVDDFAGVITKTARLPRPIALLGSNKDLLIQGRCRWEAVPAKLPGNGHLPSGCPLARPKVPLPA